MRFRPMMTAIAFAAAMAAGAQGQTIDPAINSSSLFGIDYSTGQLWRYDFATDTKVLVGTVTDVATGQVLTGIEASAYFTRSGNHPGFGQIHAIRLDPATEENVVVHIDVETAEARQTGVNLGKGLVRGATAVRGEDTFNISGSMVTLPTWRVFAVQDHPQPEYPRAVDGMANVNPSNNPHFEFTLTHAGGTITRDDLLQNADIDEHGVLYEGPASYMSLKPKGNGNQNTLWINGEVYAVSNAKHYTFASDDMTVRLFNDHVKNGKAMGHWWVGMVAETATVTEDNSTLLTPPEPWVPTSKLIALHTETGLSTTSMEFSRVYDCLATRDGVKFYSRSGSSLYRIDRSTKTETLIGTLEHDEILDFSFVGETLTGFDIGIDRLVAIDKDTGGTLGSPADIGLSEVGTYVFIPSADVPKRVLIAFD